MGTEVSLSHCASSNDCENASLEKKTCFKGKKEHDQCMIEVTLPHTESSIQKWKDNAVMDAGTSCDPSDVLFDKTSIDHSVTGAGVPLSHRAPSNDHDEASLGKSTCSERNKEVNSESEMRADVSLSDCTKGSLPPKKRLRTRGKRRKATMDKGTDCDHADLISGKKSVGLLSDIGTEVLLSHFAEGQSLPNAPCCHMGQAVAEPSCLKLPSKRKKREKKKHIITMNAGSLDENTCFKGNMDTDKIAQETTLPCDERTNQLDKIRDAIADAGVNSDCGNVFREKSNCLERETKNDHNVAEEIIPNKRRKKKRKKLDGTLNTGSNGDSDFILPSKNIDDKEYEICAKVSAIADTGLNSDCGNVFLGQSTCSERETENDHNLADEIIPNKSRKRKRKKLDATMNIGSNGDTDSILPSKNIDDTETIMCGKVSPSLKKKKDKAHLWAQEEKNKNLVGGREINNPSKVQQLDIINQSESSEAVTLSEHGKQCCITSIDVGNVQGNAECAVSSGKDVGVEALKRRKKKENRKKKKESESSVNNMACSSLQFMEKDGVVGETLMTCEGAGLASVSSEGAVLVDINDFPGRGNAERVVSLTQEECNKAWKRRKKEDRKEKRQSDSSVINMASSSVQFKQKNDLVGESSMSCEAVSLASEASEGRVGCSKSLTSDTYYVKSETLASSSGKVEIGQFNNSDRDSRNAQTHLLPLTKAIGNTKRKLLVLDLNGLLADFVPGVSKEYTPDKWIRRNAIFKRPFCDDFLNFCFERYNVGIWSSRRRENLNRAVHFLLGSARKKLLFSWDQHRCTKTGQKTDAKNNKKKPLLLKDLRQLWDKERPVLPWEKGEYNESNTLLLDDSPYKALCNPPYTAIFPEPYSYMNANDNALGPGGSLRLYLEKLASADNVQKFVKENPFGQPAVTSLDPMWPFYANIIETVEAKRREKLANAVSGNKVIDPAARSGNKTGRETITVGIETEQNTISGPKIREESTSVIQRK